MIKPMTGLMLLNCMFFMAIVLSGCGEKSGIGAGAKNSIYLSTHSRSVTANVSPVNANGASIEGVVNSKFLYDASCTGGNAVYVFESGGTVPDDIDGIGADPVDVIYLDFDSSTRRYNYKVPFLNAGEYTLAFTCQARDDVSDRDDAIQFIGTTVVTVSPGQRVIKHMFARNM